MQKRIVAGVREIVKNYPVDGIHFDDYFYPDTDKKIDAKQYAVYCADGGNLSLGDWRRSRVNDLIRAVYKAVKEENQCCTFGISPAAALPMIGTVCTPMWSLGNPKGLLRLSVSPGVLRLS